ncbi:uncharacterized protein TNIN_75131 [Trichonephila inaurata madagascariensis]|uniref:C2H2-type domain-containing protein n=2 Tax=Trichonephila inaurata madagascariensis TaxID=2747483 RepID=A0A8X6WR96_9ARAC|nr:uncharacterized protein TNIN_75131 [Trichonephila inaurata madagascariensis]
MSAETELAEAIELKLSAASPTVQSDLSTDGDTNVTQNVSVSTNRLSPLHLDGAGSEPKVKKRRKQSNPLKIQNPVSPKFDIPVYDLGDQPENETEPNISYPAVEELQSEDDVIENSRTPDYANQKSSLTRVTNALFNNKLREIAKTSTNSSKSKESSLQSLTDISSPESSEEVVLNNDFKNSVQNAYSQMPPLLPINPVDIARDTVKLGNVYSFPDFSSPVQQGNVNLSISQRSFVTSSGVRVFNPEAYCELCEKEFCNKYFLKTHKANKHGICNVDNNTGGYSYKASYKSMQMNNQAAQQMISQFCENGAAFGSADSYCNICQKYFCNKYFLKKHRQNIHGILEDSVTPSSIHVPVISSPMPLVRPLTYEAKSSESASGQITKDEELKANINVENTKNSSNTNVPLLNGSSPQTPQSKTFSQSINQKDKKVEKFLCELCNIEFCDKCYLDAHKINKHGQTKTSGSEFPDFSEIGKVESIEKSNQIDDIDESKDNFKGQMCAPCMKNFTSAESFQCHMLDVHGASLKEDEETCLTSDMMNKKNGLMHFESEGLINTPDHSPSLHDLENSNGSSDNVYNCTICLTKCKDKRSFMSHLETNHNILGNVAVEMCLLAESSTCDVCQEQFTDHASLASHKYKAHGMIPSGIESFSESLENGDYSMYLSGRQKSGGSSFCQICNKELCNKYFMKTHMMKMHGIDVDKGQQDRWPTAPGGGVYCDICQKFLCSKYFLKVHKQNVHGIIDDSTKLSTIGSPSYNSSLSAGEKKIEWHSTNFSQGIKLSNNILNDSSLCSENSKRSNGNLLSCDICGQEFIDKVSLKIHLVNKHVKSNENKIYPNSVASPFSHSVEESRDALKNGILPCSCCSFINLDDSSKLSQLNSSDVKMISCIICNVTYRQLDYHTHHLSHGVSLPIGKHLPNFENGIQELNAGFNHSGNHMLNPDDSDKLQPRKFKRFRCSKCDKTFRTKIRCLHHIQVTHKSKKGLLGHYDQNPSRKCSPNNLTSKKNLEQKITALSPENGTGLIGGKEIERKLNLMASDFQDAAQLPAPYKLPENSKVIMQPFHLSEPKPDGLSKQNIFVPSVVYLPVSQEVSETVTVAFTLTPA